MGSYCLHDDGQADSREQVEVCTGEKCVNERETGGHEGKGGSEGGGFKYRGSTLQSDGWCREGGDECQG